ncbi:hypothetical protein BCR34DRAFT_509187 [Clohesyomyces aquaticus]|uniref:Uncharacterized protein n=1 Tax=Clohesyomyces aquaticus TaxID=1231657 RepID=A0A1Y1ZXD2_9PLEO|nr:hypothetical protein BCR34DRAFT_509187 [Clohesyomyces aquaticus]
MMSKLFVTLYALNFLIGALCTSILGLTSHSIVVKDRLEFYLPPNIKSIGIGVLMWAGVGGIVDMLLFGAGLIIGALKNNKHQDRHEKNERRLEYPNSLLFVATIVFLRPLVILIYTFIEHNRSVNNVTSSENELVTPESWACDVSPGEDARSLCSDLRAARYVLIPVIVLAAGMFRIVLWVYLRTRRIRKEVGRETTGSLGEVGDLR